MEMDQMITDENVTLTIRLIMLGKVSVAATASRYAPVRASLRNCRRLECPESASAAGAGESREGSGLRDDEEDPGNV